MTYSEQMWQDAKKRYRLDNKGIALTKRLGLNPRNLIRDIPSKSEPWKASMSVWLHEIEAKHQKRAAQKQCRRAKTEQVETAPDTRETP